jgi:hypothetical protein
MSYKPITKEPVSYKEQKKENELMAKYRVILDVIKHKQKRVEVAKKYSMSRNSVRNIISDFLFLVKKEIQIELLSPIFQFSILEIEEKLSSILGKKTVPISNKRSATKEQEDLILKYFNDDDITVGAKRMHMFIQRHIQKISKNPVYKQTSSKPAYTKQDLKILAGITYSQVRGVYKRNNLKVKKRRSMNKQRVALYDYAKLACFEHLHYDTKTIPDTKALPKDIYDKFKLNPELPVIEWNIIDVKSRFRFIAYSHERTSFFGFQFIVFVLQYIRANTINKDLKITIGTDNGSEFYSGSKKKEAEWNAHFNILNAEIYSYNPGWDVRKNLIERSHKTDDEEFFVPRGKFINDKKSFMKEAVNYSYYFNCERPHSGIEMNNRTPLEVLQDCGITAIKSFKQFPTLLLEDSISEIKKCTEPIRVLKYLNSFPNSRSRLLNNDQKFINSISHKNLLSTKNAQNVLTHYPKHLNKT